MPVQTMVQPSVSPTTKKPADKHMVHMRSCVVDDWESAGQGAIKVHLASISYAKSTHSDMHIVFVVINMHCDTNK